MICIFLWAENDAEINGLSLRAGTSHALAGGFPESL